MLKKLGVLILTLSILAAAMLPVNMAFAAERITYTHNDATYGGSGAHNNYGSFTALGTNVYAKFNVKIPKAGTYSISAKVASDIATDLVVSTDTATSDAIFVETGGSGIYQECELFSTYLKEGNNTITIRNTTSAILSLVNLYLDEVVGVGAVDFSKSSGAFKRHVLPTIIEAEDFDYSSAESGVGNGILTSTYRKDSPVRIVKDVASMVIAAEEGDSMQYTFEVSEASLYDVSLIANSSGTARLYFDGGKGYVEASVIGREESSFGTVSLSAGVHSVKLLSESKGLNIDKLRFKSSVNSTSYYKPSDLAAGKKIAIEKKEEKEQPHPVWKNIYVSADGNGKGDGTKKNPYNTIQSAKEAAKKLAPSMKGDIVINIAPGTYFIKETLHFDVSDSGKNGYDIVYKGTDPNNKPIISGGRKIDGWTKVQGNIWSAKADDDITVMRQLYINELPAMVARSKYRYKGIDVYDDPNNTYEQDGFYVKKKNFPVLSNAEDMDILYNYDWSLSHFPVKQIVDEGELWRIEYDQPYFDRYYRSCSARMRPAAGVAVHLSNAPELIDEPGEFCYDKNTKTVYYYAYDNEDMTKAEVYTPQVDTLIDMRGNGISQKISSIKFDGLDFRHGAWNDIARTGMFNGQADAMTPPEKETTGFSQSAMLEDMMPSEFEINFADHIAVKNCNFINQGATALAMRDCVTNSKIEGNCFKDIAGSAILVGAVYSTKDNRTVESISRNVSVRDNVIRRIGLDYIGCVGIEVLYANSINVIHNDIAYTSYTGISVGWGWGSTISNTLQCGEHLIANNRLDHTGLAAYDGGSIYTLSEMKGTYIQGNYITNDYDYGPLYFDDGSRSIVGRDNVLADSRGTAIFKGIDITDLYNNYSNFSDLHRYVPWLTGADTKKVSERPWRTEGDNWPPEAKAIIADAGLEAEYKYLLESKNIEWPSWRKMALEAFEREEFKSTSELRMYAGDMIEGGEGVAYHDTDPKGPTVYENGGVGDTVQGEWLKYKIKPKTAGRYKMSLYYSLAFTGTEANASDTSGVTIYLDGKAVCTNLILQDTGAWDSQKELFIDNVTLSDDEHDIMVEFSTGAFAFGSILFENEDSKGNDAEYDDGILFQLPKQ